MTEELLDGADVVTILEQVGGKGVAQGVAAHGFGDAGGARSSANVALHGRLVAVVAAALASAGVDVGAACGKDPLPGPFSRSGGVFGSQGVGQRDEASARGQVRSVLGLHALEVLGQSGHDARGQGRDSVLPTLAVAHTNFVARGIDVLCAQL